MWAFTVDVQMSDDNDGYKIDLDVSPALMDRGDGKDLIKKLCNDILSLLDDAPVTEE